MLESLPRELPPQLTQAKLTAIRNMVTSKLFTDDGESNQCCVSVTKMTYFIFDIHVTVLCDKFLTIKPTRCMNFSNLFLEWNCTCFGQFLCPSLGVFHCTHYSGMCIHVCWQLRAGSGWNILILLAAVSKPVQHITLQYVHRKTPDDGQRNCPKHVEFHSKNKYEKLVHLVAFIVRKMTYLSNRLLSQ